MIHYHGTPCGGTTRRASRFLLGRHAMVPFPRQDDIGMVSELCQSFVFDNGAFSAWQSGNPVSDWSGYYDWVGTWARHPGFDWAIIPDVIDGTADDNDALIAEWPHSKIDGVPVWHMHEPLNRLGALCDSFPRVAIGSSAQFAQVGTRSWWERMVDAMGSICDANGRPPCKLHGLRMLDPEIFSRLPLASADSTNAVRNSNRHGGYAEVIADRIESHASAEKWVQPSRQIGIAFDLEVRK